MGFHGMGVALYVVDIIETISFIGMVEEGERMHFGRANQPSPALSWQLYRKALSLR